MTQKDKELLLQDICARLPYGVKMSNINAMHNGLDLPPIKIDISDYKNSNPLILINSGFRPYLRHLSSMTEEEMKEYGECTMRIGLIYIPDYNTLDWLNAHHFDYRGLIPMGLAIEVTKENNPYERF